MEVLGALNVPVSLVLSVVAVVLFYIYLTWNHSFFKKQDIPGPPAYPFIGSTFGQELMYTFHKWKQTYGNVFGVFMGSEPAFVICDLDILKEVFVKSFNNFRNRRKVRLVPYPFSLGVFFLEDAAWKRVRNIITPSFSGGKLRSMCPAINDCAATLTRNFLKTMEQEKSVDMKQYFGAFTMDVISRTAFGVKVDSQNDFSDPFVSNARKIFTPKPLRRPFILFAVMFPVIASVFRLFGISVFPRDVTKFFVKNITEIIKQRERDSKEVREKRTDFLQLLMDAEVVESTDGDIRAVNGVGTNNLQDGQSVRRLTTDEIVGQGILFFIAGYETTASTLNFASYMLANHPDVQEKAYREISDVLGDEEPDYDNISKLPYLDTVISETLRLFPPIVFLTRTATETIAFKGYTIPKGCSVFVPAYSIQRDPENFADPDKFKPERFQEKHNPFSFLSFGYGPRNCIGMRLALVEAKIALVHVLRNVKFETAPDTPEKLTFRAISMLIPKKPNMLKLTPRI